MVEKFSGMMKPGVTRMKRRLSFGLMEQLVKADYVKQMEKVNLAL
jgi:hypothetical protein